LAGAGRSRVSRGCSDPECGRRHEFPNALTDAERAALLEYLKTL